MSEELLIVNSLRTASFVSRERFFLHIMGTDFVSCPKPFLGEIIDFSRRTAESEIFNLRNDGIKRAQTRHHIEPPPRFRIRACSGLVQLQAEQSADFLPGAAGRRKDYFFANSQDPNFASRGSSAIDISRLVTDRVTVNGNREPCGAWFFPDSGMQRDPLSD